MYDWKLRETEQRREDLIGAAERQFFSRGYESVSMEDIAKEIGLHKAALYKFFKSKEALFFTVVLRGTAIHLRLLQESLQSAGTGIDQVSAIVEAASTFASKHSDYCRAIRYYDSGRFDLLPLLQNDEVAYYPPTREGRVFVLPPETTDVEVAQEIARLRLEIQAALRGAIEAGRADGTIRQGMDPAELAFLVSSLSDSIAGLSPEKRYLLEAAGVGSDRYVLDSKAFLKQALSKEKKK